MTAIRVRGKALEKGSEIEAVPDKSPVSDSILNILLYFTVQSTVKGKKCARRLPSLINTRHNKK